MISRRTFLKTATLATCGCLLMSRLQPLFATIPCHEGTCITMWTGPTWKSYLFKIPYPSGEKQVSHRLEGKTYSRITGKELTLKDILEKDPNRLENLTAITRKTLLDRFHREHLPFEKEWVWEGTKRIQDGHQPYFRTPKQIGLIFNRYEIGPGALGIQTVTVSAKSILLTSNSSLLEKGLL